MFQVAWMSSKNKRCYKNKRRVKNKVVKSKGYNNKGCKVGSFGFQVFVATARKAVGGLEVRKRFAAVWGYEDGCSAVSEQIEVRFLTPPKAFWGRGPSSWSGP